MHERQAKDSFEMPAYPMDMSVFLALTDRTFETEDEPCQGSPKVYDVSTIAQYALAYWNRYLISREEHDRSVFLAQAKWLAKWLVKHEVRIDDDAGGWPISMVHPDVGSGGSWLSALVQGCALSVLIRAYKLTRNDRFLNVAQRVARTFERDILDGGVSAPIGENGNKLSAAIHHASRILGTGAVDAGHDRVFPRRLQNAFQDSYQARLSKIGALRASQALAQVGRPDVDAI